MDAFPSILHLIIGFFLLGVLIDTGGELVRMIHTTLVVVLRFFISFTFAEVVSFLPFVALEAYAVHSAYPLLPIVTVEDLPTVAVYEGPPRYPDTSESTMALINFLAVMSLVSTAVDIDPVVKPHNVVLASASVPVAVVQFFDMVVGLVSGEDTLVPTQLSLASVFLPPLLRSPSVYVARCLMVQLTQQQSSLAASAPGLKKPRCTLLSVTEKPAPSPRRLPFDVSVLFRDQPLPALSKEDLDFWLSDRTRNAPTEEGSEPIFGRTQIDMADVDAAACVLARSVPVSALFPSISESHIGFRPRRRKLPPRPRIVALPAPTPVPKLAPVSVPEVVHVAVPRSVLSVNFKWTAGSGESLMEALGFSTVHLGQTEGSACSGPNGDFRWTAHSGVPLMQALGFASAEVDDMDGAAVCSGSGGDFKWSADSGVPLMKALGVGTVKLGVVHSA
ncbi:hypothetical protein DAEQUDRAFT_767652 [Daedalea quercina L-15889]|uniref:Uncharacterized protein n=1 Tax=Daedalea quercina L-15889 TaxID=1314783 RepID=A0A165ND21_9APHY|nr:hypothetical protein DAEQUDRAFT_767652 [Daedalea quercina L-15889]